MKQETRDRKARAAAAMSDPLFWPRLIELVMMVRIEVNEGSKPATEAAAKLFEVLDGYGYTDSFKW